MGHTSFLFEMPSLLNGAARTLDLGGLYDKGAYLISSTGAEADALALAHDWAAVGDDLAEALSEDPSVDSK
jgi:hypothetical protein